MVPPLITLEEHFLAQSVLDAPQGAKYVEQFKFLPGLREKLLDLGSLRLEEMDKGRVSFQIVSHGPGCPSADQCRSANDQLAEAVAANEQRFAGFAVLPMYQPEEAAKELERCISQHRFVGALIDNHLNGSFYDGDEYLPFWSKVQELDVPIYLHPAWPAESMLPHYAGNFTVGAARSMGSSGWGWHSETGLHILRLFAANLFDKLPKLKIIIGHFGEMLPFMLERIEALSIRWGEQKRTFKQVYDENLWITTSGVWGLAPLGTMLMNTRIDRILYSVDYPFAKNEAGLKWIEDLEASGMVTKEQLEKIAFRNAEELFNVKAPR